MKKKILIVNFRDIFGGGEVYLINLMRQLDQTGGFEIFTISPENLKYFKEAQNICKKIFKGKSRGKIFISIGNLYNYVVEAIKINRIVKKESIDIIYLNGASGLYLSPLLSQKAKTYAIKHMMIDGGLIKLKIFLHKASIKKLRKLVVISEKHKHQLIQLLGKKFEGKIDVVYNGVDETKFKIAKEEVEQGVSKNETIVILEIARLTKIKGQELLLEAFYELSKIYANLELWFAGEGDLKETLILQANEKSIDKHVKFIGFTNDVPSLLYKTDIVVLPSYNEGLPLSIIEAMAMGKAIVATKIAGIPEMITDGENGLLIAPGDTKALISALKNLIENPTLRVNLGKSARICYDQKFTNKIFQAKMLSLFEINENR